MPAAKAVLRDIADIGLDPRIAHTRCATDGRLAAPVVPTNVAVQSSPEPCPEPQSEAEPDVLPEEHTLVEPPQEPEVIVPEEKKPVEKAPEKAPVVDPKKALKPKRQ